ncbi:zf-CCHC domain-containing protein [Tanacetum coccineum]
MVIYNALPRKEYERIFMCNTAKEIWKTLLITHQGNSQVKDNKIDLLVQQYEQFVISEDESIYSAFARFNTIITSLKALDEGYYSKNYVRKFLKALHPKWRAKVREIEESKDLTSLSLDELIGNLKVHEMIIKKDSEIVKAKIDRKSLALKAKKESSEEECSTFESEDEEYVMANGKSDRKCFRCGDLNHLIGECPKPSKDKNQRAFVRGSWSDSGEEDDEKINNETCLVAQASSEVCSESSYFHDENSSIDDLVLHNEYDKLCKMSLKIITKNKRLKATRDRLEKKISILKEKVPILEKNKEIDLEGVKFHMLKIKNENLKEEALKLTKFEKSTHCLNEMLNNQKPSGEKLGLGFNSFKASSSGTNEIKFVKAQKKASFDGDASIMEAVLDIRRRMGNETYYDMKTLNLKGKLIVKMFNHLHAPHEVKVFTTICLGVDLKPDEWIKDSGCSKHMTGNGKLFSSYKACNEGNVIFDSNLRGNIIGKGYSQNSKAYVILNKHTRKVEESLNVTFDETPPPSKTSPLVDDDLDEEEAIKVTEKKNLEDDIVDETLEIDEIVNIKESRNHPLKNVIGNLNQRTLESQAQNQSNFFSFLSTIEPKNVNESLTDDSWIVAMQEELSQSIANDVGTVAKLLDEGDGVALLVVSNSETRSRGQGKHKRNVRNAKIEMACVVLVANEKETGKVQYHVMFSSLEEIVGPRVYGLVLVKKRSECMGNMNKKKSCPCCVEKKKETRK